MCVLAETLLSENRFAENEVIKTACPFVVEKLDVAEEKSLRDSFRNITTFIFWNDFGADTTASGPEELP